MAKVTQVQDGAQGEIAREAWNEAMKTVESDSTIQGDGTPEDPLRVVAPPDGIPEAPDTGISYARNGNSEEWQPAYTQDQANNAFDASGSAASVQQNLNNYEQSNDLALGDKQDKSPVDNIKYALLDGGLTPLAIQDAPPEDGSTYGFNNASWTKIAIQSDAPQDGNVWGRRNGAWFEINIGPDASDYSISNYPQDGESIASTDTPLFSANNPSFLQNGDPITSENIDSEVTFKETDALGADVPFNAEVDYSRRVISLIPTSELTKGQQYYMALNQLKDADDTQSNAPSVSFTATYAPILQGWIDSVETAGLNLPPNTTLQNLETYIVTLENLGVFNGEGIFHMLDFGGDYNCARVDFMNNYAVADEYGSVTYQNGGVQGLNGASGLLSQMSMADFPSVTSNDNSWIYKLSSNSLNTVTSVVGSQQGSSISNFTVSNRYYMGSNNNPRYELAGGDGGLNNQCWTYIQDGQDVNRLIELSSYDNAFTNLPQVVPNVRIGIGGKGTSTGISDGMGLNGILQYAGYLPDMRLKWADFITATNNYLTTL